jgi:ornithine carbamoyltransferase
MRHFLTILDLSPEEAQALVLRTADMKKADYRSDLLKGKTIALIFEKASTRTRISFEVAVRDLGGHSMLMTPGESQLGRSEPLKDTSRVLSRYVQGLVVRTFGQTKIDEIAYYSSIPVINALTDAYHPCQIMADVFTMYELTPNLEEVKLAWVGDGNNVAQSLINAATLFPFELVLAVPEGFDPDPNILAYAKEQGAKVSLTRNPEEAVTDAHYVYSDVWASMGDEAEAEDRIKLFQPYQVNDDLMAAAHPDAKYLHCLPAHRGEEVTDEVIESDKSIVWDQAENRLHMQKAILEFLFS